MNYNSIYDLVFKSNSSKNDTLYGGNMKYYIQNGGTNLDTVINIHYTSDSITKEIVYKPIDDTKQLI